MFPAHAAAERYGALRSGTFVYRDKFRDGEVSLATFTTRYGTTFVSSVAESVTAARELLLPIMLGSSNYGMSWGNTPLHVDLASVPDNNCHEPFEFGVCRRMTSELAEPARRF